MNNEGNWLSCRASNGQILDDGDVRARWIVELDVLEGNFTDTLLGLETVFARRVNKRDAVNGLVEFGRCTTCVCDGLHFGGEKGERERTNENREEDIDDNSRIR